MPQTVAVRAFHDSGCIHCFFYRTLQNSLRHVISLSFAAARIDSNPRRGKNTLPCPFARRVRKLSTQRKWQMHGYRIRPRDPAHAGPSRAPGRRRNSSDKLSGSIVTRSLPPFASRTVICASAKSMSLTRKRTHSINRNPFRKASRPSAWVCPAGEQKFVSPRDG